MKCAERGGEGEVKAGRGREDSRRGVVVEWRSTVGVKELVWRPDGTLK